MNDYLPDPVAVRRFRPLAEFVASLRFLTRIPVPFARTIDPPRLVEAMRLFPVAGAVIGAILACLMSALQWAGVPSMLNAVLTVAAGLLLTGGLHEDGAADFADGMGGGKTRERRLEIMRDSRIGNYGALTLGVILLARIAAFETLVSQTIYEALAVLMATEAFSRSLMVDLMWATKPARSDGLSGAAGRPTRGVTLVAVTFGLFATLATGFVVPLEGAVIALGLALAATALIRWIAVRLIDGQTGDVCGAAQVASQLAMLTAFVASFR